MLWTSDPFSSFFSWAVKEVHERRFTRMRVNVREDDSNTGVGDGERLTTNDRTSGGFFRSRNSRRSKSVVLRKLFMNTVCDTNEPRSSPFLFKEGLPL